MRRLTLLLIFANLCTCRSAPTRADTANLITEAAQTQSKIDQALELTDEMDNARNGAEWEKAAVKYIGKSKTALLASEQTIDNLRQSLIQSETARGDVEQKLVACETNAGKYSWLKWFLIIGGPLVLAGAFLLGRATKAGI